MTFGKRGVPEEQTRQRGTQELHTGQKEYNYPNSICPERHFIIRCHLRSLFIALNTTPFVSPLAWSPNLRPVLVMTTRV